MKPHPENRTLIEKQNKLLWRVVIRECTAHGFSATNFQVVGEGYPRYTEARYAYDEVNSPEGKPKCRTSPFIHRSFTR